ncbi:MAG: hypothetical protein ACMVP2_27505 [Imperialibacter sp.]|uniref:hypothetical protein n=1 Tax=Imperialibacter sp. TaxID=2038411 RepID=UPI003A83F6E1
MRISLVSKKSLTDIRNRICLNDWFFYQFLVVFTDELFPNADDNFKTAFIWFTLMKFGYDSRLSFENGRIYLAVRSESKSYPGYSKKKNFYSYLTFPNSGYNIEEFFIHGKSAKDFDFSLFQYPCHETTREIRKNIDFKITTSEGHSVATANVIIDLDILDHLRQFPALEFRYLVNSKLPVETHESFFKSLNSLIEGKSESEIIQLLLSFVQTSTEYSDDLQNPSLHREKWYTPFESLYYEKSDCEDRTVLLYYLVREILDIPIILIEYPSKDHVNVGIALTNLKTGLFYKGNYFKVFETTSNFGQDGTSQIYRFSEFQIQAEYFPK